MTGVITQDQRARFEEVGLIRLEGFLPTECVTAWRDVIVRSLEKQGLWRDGAWHLDELAPTASVIAGSELLKGIKKSRTFREVITQSLRDAIAELVDGREVTELADTPQLLFTLPNADTWSVPYSIWHLDMARAPQTGIPGVQMFTFLDTVAPGGGGTLMVAGSHRLLNTGSHIRSKRFKQRLKREDYFRDLMSKDHPDRAELMQVTGKVEDVDVYVIELHGEPGDVYLVDMRMLHTLAPNASDVPRMMLTQRFRLESLRAELFDVSGKEVSGTA